MTIYSQLSPEEIKAIHNATLRVLNEVGILIDDTESINLLIEHGARKEGERLVFSPEQVESCLSLCPNQVILEGRDGKVSLGDGTIHVHNLGGARDVYDPPTQSLRPATTQDAIESTRLLDALESVTTVTPLYTPRDVPPEKIVLVMFAQILRNTVKPLNGPGVHNMTDVRMLVEMARIVFGDHPAISVSVSPVSPLNFTGHVAPVLMEIARQRLPFGPLPCPSAGATSPMSLAGSLVQQNAEVLASIVLAQMVSPGLPIVYCGRLSVLNLRNGTPIWGNPEVGMMSAATVQLGHFYHLPVNVYGLAGSGFAPDLQAGYERAINALIPALAGADELSGVGEMAGGATSCNAQMVVDNDIMSMVQRVCHGFAVNDDSLAVDVIAHALATTHNFLGERHTRKYLHAGEVWQGRLGLQEAGWDAWKKAGGQTVIERAHHEALRILSQHEVPPLSDEQERAINEVVNF